jgi:hypothetical protein
MNKNDITSAFDALGGMKRLVSWAKENDDNLAKFYSMYGRTLINGGSDFEPVDADPEKTRAELEQKIIQTIEGQRAARFRDDAASVRVTYNDSRGISHDITPRLIFDDEVSGVTTPVVTDAAHENSGRPDFCDDIPHTASVTPRLGIADTGMTKAAAPQALPEQPKPKPDDGVHGKPKPDVHAAARAEPVVGLCAAAVLGEGAPPNYGVNFSQTRYWGSVRCLLFTRANLTAKRGSLFRARVPL